MYDFVIVGAGSAGCVLANRLTADPAVKVLLLEAGGPDKKTEIHIPAAFAKLFDTEFDWAYSTAAEPALGGRELFWPRGKMLGGSSSLNAQMYVRGNRADYDAWAELGNTGWGYDDVLPLFTIIRGWPRRGIGRHFVGFRRRWRRVTAEVDFDMICGLGDRLFRVAAEPAADAGWIAERIKDTSL